MKSIKFFVERSVYHTHFNLHLADQSGDRLAIARNITFQTVEEGEVFGEPLLAMKPAVAQQLMDELFAAGLRPSQAAGSSGQLDAVKFHLEDMRRLVFKGAEQK